MDLLHLRSLVTVAQHGSISDAAAHLGLSQPALSRRMQALEDEFNAVLLERSRRGVRLTEMGRLVVAEGGALVERYDQLKDTVQDHLRLRSGVLRLGGGATAVSYLLPAAIAEFQTQHPGVIFELKESGSREIEADVLADRLELGIVTLPVESAELSAQPLREDRIVLAAAEGHPLVGRRERVRVSDLDGENLVGFERSSAIRQLIDLALREAGVEMRVVMELRSIAGIVHMAATTQSLAFVSEHGLLGNEGLVTPIEVEGLEIRRQLAVIWREDRSLSPAALEFVRGLVEGATSV